MSNNPSENHEAQLQTPPEKPPEKSTRNWALGYFSKKTLSNLTVVFAGVLLFVLFFNIGTVAAAVGTLLGVISPFVAGIAIAYMLNMPMRFFEKHLFAKRKNKRTWSIVTTYLLALLVVVLLLWLVLPQIIDSVLTLYANISVYLANLNDFVNFIAEQFDLDHETLDMLLLSYQDIVNRMVSWVASALPDLVDGAMKVGSGVISALTALIASIYMLAGKEKLLRQCRRVLYAIFKPRHADGAMRVGRLSNTIFSGFISGKLVDSAIIGVICFVFMSIMNILYSFTGITSLQMPYAVLISVIVGVTNIIPFFGPFIGAIPSAAILLMVEPWSALWFIIFIIVLQQFDGNVLGPKILGESTGLPAMWVLVAIIVGGGLFGFTGMLLGVPTTAVLYTLASDIIERRLKKRGLNHSESLAPPREDIHEGGALPYAAETAQEAVGQPVAAAPTAAKSNGDEPDET